MSLLNRILACVDKIIPGLQNDTVKEWEKVTEEGKALSEEIKKLSERSKEATDSTEWPRFSESGFDMLDIATFPRVVMLASCKNQVQVLEVLAKVSLPSR